MSTSAPSEPGTSSRFGRQPFVAILAEQGRTMAKVARVLGFEPNYVHRVGQGRTALSDDFKQALSEFLGLPCEDLFTTAALNTPFVVQRNTKGVRS